MLLFSLCHLFSLTITLDINYSSKQRQCVHYRNEFVQTSFLTYFYTVSRLWPPLVNIIKLLQIEVRLQYLP